jgi:hypothetical protein
MNHIDSLAVVLLVSACVASGCGSQESEVHVYEVVNEYRGTFVIVEDKVNGLDVVPVAGELTYAIPETGILRVKDMHYIHYWHSAVARYANGLSIPDGNMSSPDTVSFHSISYVDGKYHWFAIGTQADVDESLGSERITKMLEAK